jgi:methylmalonyl-CoA mutase
MVASTTRRPRVRRSAPRQPLYLLRHDELPDGIEAIIGACPAASYDLVTRRRWRGDPFRTNRRFKLLSAGSEATRLSTAFGTVILENAKIPSGQGRGRR